MKDGKVFIWMNLLGFDRDDSDRGVERFLNQTGFTPDGVCALVCNSDFFHQHKGMEEEYTLPPDVCAYWGIPRNAERERQPWTNYDIRTLCENLSEKGVNTYASIFGNNLDSAFHREWIEDFPEIHRDGRDGAHAHTVVFVLRRFNDGTYYEDFFIEKVCQTLTDYGMKGIHLADNMCPPFGGMMSSLDFSTDFIDQFLTHTNLTLPDELMKTLGDDSKEVEIKRGDWIYHNLRAEWIEFSAWRWEVFFKKLATRLHAINKEILVLGMYCTDPFETLYCLGIDLKKIVNAGVDLITANILPASCFLCGPDWREEKFHRYMAIASTTAAHLPKNSLVSMLGLQDPTEEWSAMHHAPTRHERDLYTMMAYHTIDADGASRALDGYFLCLGDGICRSDWDWERDRLERAMSTKGQEIISPVMLWSEVAHEKMLREYISTRRWTPHKHFYELSKKGAMCGATIKPDGLKYHNGAIFVPNFDMLPENEKEAILNYGGPVLCTASPDFKDVKSTFSFSDSFSTYPLKAFVLNADVSDDFKAEIDELLITDDGTENLKGDILDIEEPTFVLNDTLVFQKVTDGFITALAKVLNHISKTPFEINKPNIVIKQTDGSYRLYLFNDSNDHYNYVFVKSEKEISDTKTVTHFPILPPRWIKESNDSNHHVYKEGENPIKKSFQIKIPPADVTIIDVYF